MSTHALLVLALAVASVVVRTDSEQGPREILDRAMADFRAGRVAESVAGFDRLAKLVPEAAPQLWQRGIALYYAGRYQDCREQFASHRAVNPNDVENAAWHYLCVARAESPQNARAKILPVGQDSRVPMAEVYQMFLGRSTEAQVLTAAGANLSAQFYAHLYVGLYLDATGDRTRAREHLALAAADRYASVGGYMHDVARVHLKLVGRTSGLSRRA